MLPTIVLFQSRSTSNFSLWNILVIPLVIGLVVALVTVWSTEYVQTHRHSNLQFLPIMRMRQTWVGDKPEDSGTAYFWRLPIVNTSSHPARSAVTQLSAIRDNGTNRSGVIASPFNWMHNPPAIFDREIFRSQVAYLDICQWSERSADHRYCPTRLSWGYPNQIRFEQKILR